MKYFQSISFILEIIISSAIIAFGVLYSLNIIKDRRSWLNSGKVYKIVIEIILRIAFFLFMVYWAYSTVIPKVIEIPKLVTGNLSTLTGYVTIGSRGNKDLYQHIYINGTRVDFFLESGIKRGELCKVVYLPKSHRGIMIERVGKDLTAKEKKVGIPWGAILSILYLLVAVIFFNKYAFYFLAVASAVYYPIHFYFYYKYVKLFGTWFSKANDPMIGIIGGVGFLAIPLLMYLFERFFKKRSSNRYVSRYGDSNDYYLTKQMVHIVVFVYIMMTLSLLKLI